MVKKTVKRNRKDMRVYKDSNGQHSIIEVFLNTKNEIVGIGDIQMPVASDVQGLKNLLFSMFKATRHNIIDDEFLHNFSKMKRK